MALLKQIELETGIIIEYWRITTQISNYNTNQITAVLSGYLNKEKRDLGHKPVKSVKIVVPASLIEEDKTAEGEKILDVSRKNLYTDIKTLISNVDITSKEPQDQTLIKFIGVEDI